MTWSSHLSQLKYVREQVFIREQHVPVDMEWDGADENAVHLIVLADGQGIACARIVDNTIGRMAVLTDWRRKGVGRTLLEKAIEVIQNHGIKIITLSAQIHAVGFYQHAGFAVVSEAYIDAGIMHVDMQLKIA